MKIKLTLFTGLFVFLFYFSLFIAGFFPYLAEHKKDLSQISMMDYTSSILLHPIKNINLMLETENPMLYISTGAALVLFFYLLFKMRKKGYENVGETYGVHGSSRWAKNSEIFTVPEQITVVPSQGMYTELKRTLTLEDKRDESK